MAISARVTPAESPSQVVILSTMDISCLLHLNASLVRFVIQDRGRGGPLLCIRSIGSRHTSEEYGIVETRLPGNGSASVCEILELGEADASKGSEAFRS